MGKKHKDKASKSKKKSKKDIVMEPESGSIQDIEDESESIQYSEQVTAEDVMELVNTLSTNLDQLNSSNQSLQQQIAQNHKTSQRQYTVFSIIALILVVGIVTVGYTTTDVKSGRADNNDIISASMNEMTGQINSMNNSIASMSRDLNNLTTSLNTVSANVTRINQNVNKVATDVSKINAATASKPAATRYMGRPMDPRMPWR